MDQQGKDNTANIFTKILKLLKQSKIITLISLIYAIILTVASTLRYKCESYPDFKVGNDILIKRGVSCGNTPGWPFAWLDRVSGGLLHTVNYIFFVLDILFYFIITFIVLLLIRRLIANFKKSPGVS